MQRADINRVRASVHQQCGSSVMIQLDRGRNKVDVQRGVIQNVLFCKLNDAPVVTLNDAITV